VERKNEGGFNKESVLLNIETFKGLCMLAGTDKSKEIRKYYLQLETVFQELVNEESEELRKQIEQAAQRSKNLELALKAERINFSRAANKGIVKDTPEKCVYICQGVQGYKIGETSNSYNRESALKTGGVHNKLVYTKKVHDRRLVEKLTHHLLSEYRISNTHEWFDTSYEIAKLALDCASLFADGLMNKVKTMYEVDFYSQLKTLVDSLSMDVDKDASGSNIDTCVNESTSECVDEKQIIDIDTGIKNALDFDAFVAECCVKGDNFTAFSVDVFGAHRLWSRCNEKSTHDALYKYLGNNFKKVKVFDQSSNANLISYKGIQLRPITFQRDESTNDVDDFIDSKCKLSYNARYPAKELYSHFESWKKESEKDYVLTASEKKRIDNDFSMKFLCSKVYNGTCSVLGYFGIAPKDDTKFVGLKLASKLKKQVIKVNIITGEVVETYESLTAASKIVGKGPAYLSQDIRFKKPHGYFIYKYA
jgi:hypothetical protein